jgi:hypothetical protein
MREEVVRSKAGKRKGPGMKVGKGLFSKPRSVELLKR